MEGVVTSFVSGIPFFLIKKEILTNLTPGILF